MNVSVMRTYLTVSAAINVCVAIIVAARFATYKPRRPIMLCWAAFAAAVALWAACYFCCQISETAAGALLASRLLLVPAGFIGPLFYHHMTLLIGSPPRKPMLVFLYGLSILNAVLTLCGYSARSVEPLFDVEYWPRAGEGFIVFLATYGMFLVACTRGVMAARNARGYNSEAIRIHCVIGLAGAAVGFTNLPGWYGISLPPWTNGLVAPYLIGASCTAYGATPGILRQPVRLARRFLFALVLCGLAVTLSVVSIWMLARFGGIHLHASAWLAVFAYHLLLVVACYAVIPQVVEFETRIWQFLHPTESNIARAVARMERTVAACRPEECGAIIARELKAASGTLAVAFYHRTESGTLELAGASGPIAGLPPSLDDQQPIVRECVAHDAPLTLRWVEHSSEAEWASLWHSAIPVVRDKAVSSILLLAQARSLPSRVLHELQVALHRVDGLLQTRLVASRMARQESLARLGYLAAGIAHEVRNPLTSIKTYVDLNHRGALPPAGEAELYAEVQAGIQRMLGAIEAVSAFADNRNSTRAVVRLHEAVEQTTAMCAAALRQANVTCVNDVAPDIVVWANHREVLQVLANLFTNAIEAMRPQRSGRLSVSAEAISSHGPVRIRVADTGPGLPPAIVARLGQPFVTTRSNGYEPGRKSGYGLGLSIAMDRVVAHGGTFAYHAPAFIFTLPQPSGFVRPDATDAVIIAEPASKLAEATAGSRV